MKDTRIAWCDHTFNPWIGCTKISPACDHCYAEQIASRFKMAEWGDAPRKRTSAQNWRQLLRWDAQARAQMAGWETFIEQNKTSEADLLEKGFIKPKRPKVFCGSMCDVFDNRAPEQWRDDLFALIDATPNLDWLLLTKRIGNAAKYIQTALPNVWLGITVCNQQEAKRDIPKLLCVPATKRFLSIEPMLGPIDIGTCVPPIRLGPDWVICGGESGHGARPMHPDWARYLHDQCKAAGVPFFFKQWGEWFPRSGCYHKFSDGLGLAEIDPLCKRWPCIRMTFRGGNGWRLEDVCADGDDAYMQRVGTKKAGCLLDGVECKGFPE